MPMTGLVRLTDDLTEVNIPYHQFKSFDNGFEANWRCTGQNMRLMELSKDAPCI